MKVSLYSFLRPFNLPGSAPVLNSSQKDIRSRVNNIFPAVVVNSLSAHLFNPKSQIIFAHLGSAERGKLNVRLLPPPSDAESRRIIREDNYKIQAVIQGNFVNLTDKIIRNIVSEYPQIEESQLKRITTAFLNNLYRDHFTSEILAPFLSSNDSSVRDSIVSSLLESANFIESKRGIGFSVPDAESPLRVVSPFARLIISTLQKLSEKDGKIKASLQNILSEKQIEKLNEAGIHEFSQLKGKAATFLRVLYENSELRPIEGYSYARASMNDRGLEKIIVDLSSLAGIRDLPPVLSLHAQQAMHCQWMLNEQLKPHLNLELIPKEILNSPNGSNFKETMLNYILRPEIVKVLKTGTKEDIQALKEKFQQVAEAQIESQINPLLVLKNSFDWMKPFLDLARQAEAVKSYYPEGAGSWEKAFIPETLIHSFRKN